MTLSPEMPVADIVAISPATIKVFQRHRIEFCCGGRMPLADACDRHGLDALELITELEAALLKSAEETDWTRAPLADVAAYVQRRFHRPLAAELSRLHAMLTKVIAKHGERFPESLLPLQSTFDALQDNLREHVAKEDAVLFPAIVALEGHVQPGWEWIAEPIAALKAEHAKAEDAFARIVELTGNYVPPPGACPTFVGLYYGLAELEREERAHLRLENRVLLPRAAELATQTTGGLSARGGI